MAEAAASSAAGSSSKQTMLGAFIVTRAEKTELLVCVKCCKLALQPVLVGNCLHSLCFRCAAGASQKAVATSDGGSTDLRDGSIACPRCGDGGPEADSGGQASASQPKANHLAELLGRMLGASRSDAPCNFCAENDSIEIPAVRWCIDCGKYACLPCSSWHDRFHKSHRSRTLSSAASLWDSGSDEAGMACDVCSGSTAGNEAAKAPAASSVAVSWCEPCSVTMCRQCTAWHDRFHRGHKKVVLQPGDSVVRPPASLRSKPQAAAAPSPASAAAAAASAAVASTADPVKGSRSSSASTTCRQHDLQHEYFCDSCSALKCTDCSSVCREASHSLFSIVVTGSGGSDVSHDQQIVQRTHDATVAVRVAQAALAAAASALDNQAAAASELKRALEDDCAMLARNKRLVLDAVESVFEKAEQTVRRRYEARLGRAEAALAAIAAADEETAAADAAAAAGSESDCKPSGPRGRPSLREAAGHALSYVRVLLHLATDPALVLDQQRLVVSRLRSLTDRLMATVTGDDDDFGDRSAADHRVHCAAAVRPASDVDIIELVLEQFTGLYLDKRVVLTGANRERCADAIQTGSVDSHDVTKTAGNVDDSTSKSGRVGSDGQVPDEEPSAAVQSQRPKFLNSEKDDEDYWSEENRKPGSRLVPRNPGATRLVVNQIEEGPVKATKSSLPQLSSTISGTALVGISGGKGESDTSTVDAKAEPSESTATGRLSSGNAISIPPASRTFDVRGDCRDVAITDDGRVLLAALTKGMRQYASDGRQLPTWRPPRSGNDKACVSTVEVLSDGRAAAGIINHSVIVLLRRLASPGSLQSADAASDAWTEETRIRLNSKPYRMASHGDWLVVAGAHTSERRMDAGVLAVMVSTQCGPGPDLDFVSTAERRVVKRHKLDYNVIGVALAGATADTFVVASSEKQLTSDGRWHFVIDAYDRDGCKRLWRHSINEEVYDLIEAPMSSTLAANTGIASWILYVMLPESRRVAAVDGATGQWLVDAYHCSSSGSSGKGNSNSLRSPTPKPVRLAATHRRERSAIAAILYLNDSVSMHDFLG